MNPGIAAQAFPYEGAGGRLNTGQN